MNPSTITIDNQLYVRADSVPEVSGDHVLIRSHDAGVFAGVLVNRDGDEVELANARRIWKWDGAATLSELAVNGTSRPGGCKFPAAVPSITVLGVCEIIPMTTKAVDSIYGVAPWSAS